MAVFGPKLRRFGRAPPDLAPPARAATGEFLAQNLDLARLGSNMATWGKDLKSWDGAMAKTARRRVVVVVVACCLLLAKFKGSGPEDPPGRARSARCGAKGPQHARICTFYTKCHSAYTHGPPVYPLTTGDAVHTQGDTHKRRSVAVQTSCYLRGMRGLAPASSAASRSVGRMNATPFTRMPLPFIR